MLLYFSMQAFYTIAKKDLVEVHRGDILVRIFFFFFVIHVYTIFTNKLFVYK